MPHDDSLRLHEHERLPPLLQHPHYGQPEDAIAVVDIRPLDAALVDGELMTERDVLERELRTVFDRELPQAHEQREIRHPGIILAVPGRASRSTLRCAKARRIGCWRARMEGFRDPHPLHDVLQLRG